MKLYTYSGETPTEALKKAQAMHGDEALVVENKTIRKKTLTEPGLYEIVVQVDEKTQKELEHIARFEDEEASKAEIQKLVHRMQEDNPYLVTNMQRDKNYI